MRRYDVKYGSAGFNLFGYQGGCEFSLGTYEDALASPLAARYLCTRSEALKSVCLDDYSGEGVCYGSDLWDGFFRASPVRCSPCMSRFAALQAVTTQSPASHQ